MSNHSPLNPNNGQDGPRPVPEGSATHKLWQVLTSGDSAGPANPVLKPTVPRTGEPRPCDLKSRLSILFLVSCQRPEADPFASDHRASVWLDSDEAVYDRPQFKIENSWVWPEGCWVKRASIVNIINHGIKFFRNPTDSERIAAQALVIDVGIVVESAEGSELVLPFAEVQPGRSLPLSPSEGRVDNLRVRCRQPDGKVRVTIQIFPR